MKSYIEILTESVSDISRVIRETVAEYVEQGQAPSAYQINNGLCESFARDVITKLGGESDTLYDIGAENFTVGGLGDEWDDGLLARYWPKCVPTHGLSWEDLRRRGWHSIPAHVWIVYNKRHYDSECPEGVDNFFELPLIRRIMQRLAGLEVPDAQPRFVRESTDGDRIAYHVTPRENVEQIMTQGLTPNRGDRSHKMGEPGAAIYLFPTTESVGTGLDHWLMDEFEEDAELALFRVRIPADARVTSEVDFELVCHTPIPAANVELLSHDVTAEPWGFLSKLDQPSTH